jgi:hypothetical protein
MSLVIIQFNNDCIVDRKFCGLCVEELSKTGTTVGRDVWRHDLNSKRVSPEYEFTALLLSQPARHCDCVYGDPPPSDEILYFGHK